MVRNEGGGTDFVASKTAGLPLGDDLHVLRGGEFRGRHARKGQGGETGIYMIDQIIIVRKTQKMMVPIMNLPIDPIRVVFSAEEAALIISLDYSGKKKKS
ncbi:unnamed protein product [Prunus armeniaca]|uniref:Uncharacterized protein n=1 Tax=Prunus armeniaca TaxID=36596 RepID=A0A6J5VRK9_PRUAR|nr:unnamed protein product [Prunus armeniaca]